MSDSNAAPKERPLSPHLQVYRLPLTAKTSILHRMTGVVLSIGTLMVTCWLIAAASGEDAYNAVHGFMQSPLGTFMMFGWSAALFYHLCNGVRHLIWDMGFAFKKETALKASWLVILGAIILTASAWYCAIYNTKYPEASPAQTQQLVEADIVGETE